LYHLDNLTENLKIISALSHIALLRK
jgi:hypothetical protein